MLKGMLAKKLGMTRVFLDDGRLVPVTVLQVGPCQVVQRKTAEKDGYEAVQLGFGEKKDSRCNKPERGHFAKAGIAPSKFLREFRVEAGCELKPGDSVTAGMFTAGEHVDVSGITKGKGFQGVIKRHGYKGGPGGHGSMFHRAPGSIGQCADPAETYKGKGMPGHMGCVRRTSSFIEIVRIDTEKNLVLLRGAVPGPTEALIMIKKSVKGGK